MEVASVFTSLRTGMVACGRKKPVTPILNRAAGDEENAYPGINQKFVWMAESPTVSGVSPREGLPGTKVTIRGENLGNSKGDVIGNQKQRLFLASGAHIIVSMFPT